MVSSAALAAQYAMLLPDPVNAEMEDTETTVASPDFCSKGSIARVIENVPPALVSKISLNSALSRVVRSVCGIRVV